MQTDGHTHTQTIFFHMTLLTVEGIKTFSTSTSLVPLKQIDFDDVIIFSIEDFRSNDFYQVRLRVSNLREF